MSPDDDVVATGATAVSVLETVATRGAAPLRLTCGICTKLFPTSGTPTRTLNWSAPPLMSTDDASETISTAGSTMVTAPTSVMNCDADTAIDTAPVVSSTPCT